MQGSGNKIGKKSTGLPQSISKGEPEQLPLIHPLSCGQPHLLAGTMFLMTPLARASPQAGTTKSYRNFMDPEVGGRPELLALLPQGVVGSKVCGSRNSKCPALGLGRRSPSTHTLVDKHTGLPKIGFINGPKCY